MPELGLYQRPLEIEVAWRQLAVHADGCDVCLPYVAQLGAVPDDPRRADFEVYDELCDEGKGLFGPWRDAKNIWLAGTVDKRRRQFITDEQMAADGVNFELRAQALDSMPQKVFQEWLNLPDEVRHSRLRALENGIGHRLVGVQTARVEGWEHWWYRWKCVCGAEGGAESAAAAQEEYEYHAGKPRQAKSNGRAVKICEGCGKENYTGGRYHSRECRLEHQGC